MAYAIEERLGVRVPTRDGLELSANLWLPVPDPARPDERPDERFPAILEMIPYGKDNWRFNTDVARGRHLARRGFALCRLDVRGTGSSEGIARDEYTAEETRDGYDAVEWLAAQPWSNGNVGMWGISYGGFTAIQVAKLRPPHLRAIFPVMATDDRYLDDVHYRGGCATASELSQYALSQVAMNAMPPDPAHRGNGWIQAWRDRLERTPPWLFEWLRQQTDGPYWRQGSLAPEYEAIEAAIYQVGGWNDSYVDPVFRMQARCTAPIRSLVGNWAHDLPDTAYPGPNLDWLDEMVRFFDRWLNGSSEAGAAAGSGDAPDAPDAPGFVWFEREFTRPEPFPARLEGRWRAASTFPHPAVRERAWPFAGGDAPLVGRLLSAGAETAGAETEGAETAATVESFPHRATWGTRSALSWGAGGAPNGLGRDLRPDESLVPTWTSDPLAEPVEVLGIPEVVLFVAASAPVATVVVRLTDVAPDGTSALVSAGALNLTHRRSHTDPEPLEPGCVEEVRVPLRAAGYRFRAGHRFRVTVGSGYWPVLWPSPLPCELSVHTGAATPSRLVLPIVPPAGGIGDLAVPVFKVTPPELEEIGDGDEDRPVWRIEEDVIAGTVTVHVHDGGTSVLPDGRRLYAAETIALTASDADPARASIDADVVYRWRERSFETEIRARSTRTSTAEAFDLMVDLEVTLDGEPFFARRWSESIPRRLV